MLQRLAPAPSSNGRGQHMRGKTHVSCRTDEPGLLYGQGSELQETSQVVSPGKYAENSLQFSGSSFKPGVVIYMYSVSPIEINNKQRCGTLHD